MTATLLPNGSQVFLSDDGTPLAGGQVLMCVPGTLTLKSTWQDPAGTILNQNPVPLDAAGRALILGIGDYRQILYDSDGNEIWDRPTSAPLPGSAISSVMAPIVAATSLQQARDLMGITQAIQDATSAIALMPGPGGPTGPIGPLGPTGPAGPAGTNAGGQPQFSAANPGFWFDPTTGFLINFGQSSTNSTGAAVLGFAKGYNSLMSVVAVSVGNPINAVLRVVNPVNTGFSVLVEDTNNTIGVGTSFYWKAMGFG